MSDNFVGFAQSPKADPKRSLQRFHEDLDFQIDQKTLLSAFAVQSTYDQILHPLVKFDFRPGGKLLFAAESEYRGTFSQISIPRLIVLNTELHGEIRFGFKLGKTSSRVVVDIQKALLPEEILAWQKDAEKVAISIRRVFGGD